MARRRRAHQRGARRKRYTADGYVDVLETYSGHRAMTPAQRDRLYRDVRTRIAARPDGCVRKHYLNVLHVARRTDQG